MIHLFAYLVILATWEMTVERHVYMEILLKRHKERYVFVIVAILEYHVIESVIITVPVWLVNVIVIKDGVE